MDANFFIKEKKYYGIISFRENRGGTEWTLIKSIEIPTAKNKETSLGNIPLQNYSELLIILYGKYGTGASGDYYRLTIGQLPRDDTVPQSVLVPLAMMQTDYALNVYFGTSASYFVSVNIDASKKLKSLWRPSIDLPASNLFIDFYAR